MAKASGDCLPLPHPWDMGGLLTIFLTKVLFSPGTGWGHRRHVGPYPRRQADTEADTPAESLTRSSATSEPG